jgi:hypothetical protein
MSRVLLAELVGRLAGLDDTLTLYAAGGPDASPHSRAATHPGPGLDYLLEVAEAKEVVPVWREWRSGMSPSVDEACEAIAHYASRDAYVPLFR